MNSMFPDTARAVPTAGTRVAFKIATQLGRNSSRTLRFQLVGIEEWVTTTMKTRDAHAVGQSEQIAFANELHGFMFSTLERFLHRIFSEDSTVQGSSKKSHN